MNSEKPSTPLSNPCLNEGSANKPAYGAISVEEIQSICSERLETMIINMLISVDDRLFEMAENTSNSTQFDSMRLLRVKRNEVVNRFKEYLASNFERTLNRGDAGAEVKEIDKDSHKESVNRSRSRDDALEEAIAIDAMINKAKNRNKHAIEHIKLRLSAIVNRKVEQSNNPFEPSYICNAFENSIRNLQLDIGSLLVVYKLFDRCVIDELQYLYHQVNHFFIQRNVLPELKDGPLKDRRTRSASKTTKTKKNSKTKVKGNTKVQVKTKAKSKNKSSDDVPFSSLSTQVPIDIKETDANDVLGIISQLVIDPKFGKALTQPNSNNVHSFKEKTSKKVYKQITTKELISRLSDITLSAMPVGTSASNPGKVRVRLLNARELLQTQLPYMIKPEEFGALAHFHEEVIDVVSTLFDYILQSETIRPELKAVISRLQLPILRLCFIDKRFFSNRLHSARVLLNELTSMAVMWDDRDKKSHPIYDQIKTTVERVNISFHKNVAVFTELLNDFLEFKHQYQTESHKIEDAMLLVEKTRADLMPGKQLVDNTLTAICKNQYIPEIVESLLKNIWSPVLLWEHKNGDKDGWKRKIVVAQLLVWSVQPILTKKRLEKVMQRIVLLIKGLRKGMNSLPKSELDYDGELQKLELVHHEIFNDAKALLAEEQATSADNGEVQRKAPTAKIVYEEVVFGEETLEIPSDKSVADWIENGLSQLIYPLENADSNTNHLIENMEVGSWVELALNDETVRFKFVTKNDSDGRYVFVDSNGHKAVDLTIDHLSRLIQHGALKVFKSEPLFERAFEVLRVNRRSEKVRA